MADKNDFEALQKKYLELEDRYTKAAFQSGLTVWIYDVPSHAITKLRNNLLISLGDYIPNIPEAMISQNFVHPDDVDIFSKFYYRIISDGENSSTVDARIKNEKTGGYYFLHMCLSVTAYDRDGKPWKLLGTATDISRQKEIENQYKEQVTYKNTLSDLNDGLIKLNLSKDVVTKVNIKGQSTPNIKIGISVSKLFDILSSNIPRINDKKAFKKIFNKDNLFESFRNGQRDFSLQHLYKFTSDNTQWILSSISLLENPVTLDIEALLFAKNINYEKVVQQSYEKIMYFNYEALVHINSRINTLTVLSCKNPEYRSVISKLKNYTQARAVLISVFVYKDDVEQCYKDSEYSVIIDKLAHEEKYTINYRQKTNTSEFRRKQIQFFYIDKEQGIICATKSDVTQFYEEEQKKRLALEQALALAKESNEAKSEFLSRVSHEIRTPMNGILGMTNLAISNKDVSPKVLDYLKNIKISGMYLLELVNNLLDISKIEKNQFDLNPEPITINDLLSSVQIIINPRLDQKNIKLVIFHTCSTENVILLDKMIMQQILINILSNAIKFSKINSEIELTITEEPMPDNYIHLIIICNDFGIGISQSFIPKMFEPFERESKGNIEHYNGTGLGLAITKRFIDLMHGTISVESAINKGTKIIINLEFEIVNKYKKVKIEEQEALLVPCFAGKKALVAEDDFINIELIKTLLEEWGFTVNVAEDGQSALDMFIFSEPNFYDVVLMDIRMPIMDGLTACKKIRSLERSDSQSVPIIAMSANAYIVDKEKSIEAGMDDYVSKPFVPDDLYQKLKIYCKIN